MDIKFKKLHVDAKVPSYATEGSAGFDISSIEDVVIRPQETKVIHTGLVLEIPQDTALMLYPRSGVSAKTTLRMANSVGVIDSDYRGEILIILYNMAAPIKHMVPQYILTNGEKVDGYEFGYLPEGTILVKKGDRIAQGIVHDVSMAKFIPEEDITKTTRGKGGLGSSGK